MKEKLFRILPYIIAAFVLLMLGSLHWGWLNTFFFGAEHAQVQGIDYFAVPKSYLNLLEGRSMFDTWGGTPYGPYATWYLAHPAFSLFVASWFSFFSPWISYFLFAVFSLCLMIYSAYLISTVTDDKLQKQICFFILLCAFPTYWMLFVGNMHASLVLALTLIMLSVFEMTYGQNYKKAKNMLLAGLLISFFTKPIVLLMLPLFLILKETRGTTVKSILIYVFVSLLFIVVPVLNPEGIGMTRITGLLFDFNFIKENLNIYKNHFVLNEYMKDNSIHWFNLIAQSDYKLMHIDIFSLPVFIDTILGHEVSSTIYKIPIYISLLMSVAVAFIPDKRIRLESSLLLIMAISLTFFLSYNTVWEYQFTSALPVIALLPILKKKNVFYKKYITVMFSVGLLFCLPTFYFLVHNCNYQSTFALTLIRFNRIIPALVLFLIMMTQLILIVKKHLSFKEGRTLFISPEKFFFY